MGWTLTHKDLNAVLAELGAVYDLIGPCRVPQGGSFSDTDLVTYGPVRSLADLVLDQPTYFSPKEWLLPIRQTLFRFHGDEVSEPDDSGRPQILFVRPCDIHGIDRLDRIFLGNGSAPDPAYAKRRARTHLFMLECSRSFPSCFCVSMGTNRVDDYTCAFRIAAETVDVDCPDRAFADWFVERGELAEVSISFVQENQEQVAVPATAQVDLDAVCHDGMWDEYSARCIACGRCNTSCITCSCFSMQDVLYDHSGALGERRRVWAGCHIDGFTDMAGGHAFRRKHGDRMRFKTMHKVYDYHKRFGVHMCVGCGRCDNVCPEYISFPECIRKYSAVVEGGGDGQ